jgi:hypothetical protein
MTWTGAPSSPKRTWVEEAGRSPPLFLTKRVRGGTREKHSKQIIFNPSTLVRPGFPVRFPIHDSVCPFTKESRMEFVNAINLRRKSGETWGTRPTPTRNPMAQKSKPD